MTKPFALSIAAAACCLAWCSPVCAQSNVTLFGLLDAGLRIDHTSSGTTRSLQSGVASGSRWGVRGTEDLGAGLKASFILEAGFQGDTGVATANGSSGTGFGRQAVLSLSEPTWGTLGLGRQYTPIFNLAAGKLDPLGFGMIGGLQNTQSLQNGVVARVSNALTYATPTWNGWRLDLLVAPGEELSSGRQHGGSLVYAQGPLLAGYAYHYSRGLASAAAPEQYRHEVGATYDFSVLKLFGSVGLNRTSGPATTKVDRINPAIALSVPVLGTGSVIAQWQASFDRTALNADSRQVSLALDYFLSKRTDVYTGVALTTNAATAAVGITDATNLIAGTVAAGSDPRSLQLGLRHRF